MIYPWEVREFCRISNDFKVKNLPIPSAFSKLVVFKVGFDWYVQTLDGQDDIQKKPKLMCAMVKSGYKENKPYNGYIPTPTSGLMDLSPISLLYAKECEFRPQISYLWGFLIFHISSKPTFLEAETIHSLMGSAPYINILGMRKCLPECQSPRESHLVREELLILQGKTIPRYILLGCIYNYLGSKSKTIYNSKASFLCHEFIFLTFLPVFFLDQKNLIISSASIIIWLQLVHPTFFESFFLHISTFFLGCFFFGVQPPHSSWPFRIALFPSLFGSASMGRWSTLDSLGWPARPSIFGVSERCGRSGGMKLRKEETTWATWRVGYTLDLLELMKILDKSDDI